MIPPRLAIVALHADVPERQECWDRTIQTLWPQCRDYGVMLYPCVDRDLRGVDAAFYKAMIPVLETSATHVTFLPDDALYCPDFVGVLLNVVEARPDKVLCCLVNHPDAESLPRDARFYTTPDGSTCFAGTMTREMWLECLEWGELRDMRERVAHDAIVNQWAMATGRKIWKPVPAIIGHDTSVPSLVNTVSAAGVGVIRHSVGFIEGRSLSGIDWDLGRVVDLGPTYRRRPVASFAGPTRIGCPCGIDGCPTGPDCFGGSDGK